MYVLCRTSHLPLSESRHMVLDYRLSTLDNYSNSSSVRGGQSGGAQWIICFNELLCLILSDLSVYGASSSVQRTAFFR